MNLIRIKCQIVREAVKKASVKWLNSQKKTKMNNLSYDELKMQKYFSTNKLTIRQKNLVFKIRTRMIPVKNNYGADVICQICKKPESSDDQIHGLFECTSINPIIPENIQYEDIFGTNWKKTLKITTIANDSLRKGLTILDKEKETKF